MPSRNRAKTPPIIEQSLYHIDKLIRSASISAFKNHSQNVGVVSCQYSINLQQNNIKQYIFVNPGAPATRLLVPILLSNRIVLAVFHWENLRVEYYDSLKLDICQQFYTVKDAVEKFLGYKFHLTDQKAINETINDNPIPLLANIHICRIAEDMCLLKNYQKLENFDIKYEARRMKRILDTVSDTKWNGQWINNLWDREMETRFDTILYNLDTSLESNLKSKNSDVEITENVLVYGIPIILQNMQIRDKPINKEMNDVVDSMNTEAASTSESSSVETLMINCDSYQIDERSLIVSELLSTHSTYPVLSEMLKFYSNLKKLRNATYKDDPNLPKTIQKTFNWKIYSILNISEKNKGSTILKDFPFFTHLSPIDKSLLLHHFWTPFLIFGRIFDTFFTLGDEIITNRNLVILQDKSIYDLDALIKTNNFKNCEKWKSVEQLFFGYWISMLKLMKELKPDILEIMFIFCCIFWNISFLDTNLAEESEEIIRRGRLIIHQEMRKFYIYDNEKWKRIYQLKNMILLTENNVKEYKKRFVADT